jgi:hypothetical protein
MLRKEFISAFVVIALVTSACGITFNLPTMTKTGPTIEEELLIEAVDTEEPVNLSLAFGAGKLQLEPGAEDDLLTGTVRYNVEDFKPKVSEDQENISIEQGNLQVTGIPSFEGEVVNEWDFKLGSQLLNLNIQAGAYTGELELGGLSIERLQISDGASNVIVSFSEPNQTTMDVFDYTTGASNVTLEKLANANLKTMTFRSGAGNYRLDFSGELQQDVEVHIDSGVSSVVIVVPQGVNAEVSFEGELVNIAPFEEWERDGDQYILKGEGPLIKIFAKMGAGNFELRNR